MRVLERIAFTMAKNQLSNYREDNLPIITLLILMFCDLNVGVPQGVYLGAIIISYLLSMIFVMCLMQP